MLPALVILVGAILRIGALDQNTRFHPDEALFAAQARLISHEHDWLLRTTDLDKPPLTLYVTALSFTVLGPSEFAARIPNVLFSLLTLAVVWRMATALYQNRVTAILTTWILALSPYLIAFAPTTFTDVQAAFWMLLGLALICADRWRAAGAAAALAFASKSNAAYLVPILVALGIARHARPDWTVGRLTRRLINLAIPLSMGMLALVLWNLSRAPKSYVQLAWEHNNPGRLIRSSELLPRLETWSGWLRFLTGSGWISALMGVIVLAGMLLSIRHLKQRHTLLDGLIFSYVLAFFGWHWLVAFNTYDRYLYPIIPLIAILVARAIQQIRGVYPYRHLVGILCAMILTVGILPGSLRTVDGRLALGGDHGTYAGIDDLANYLNNLPATAIIYDHWLGWELAYYLGPDSIVAMQYMPLPEALANEISSSFTETADDIAGKETARYLVAPSAKIAAPWLTTLERVNINATVAYSDNESTFTLYELTAPPENNHQ